MGLLVEDPHRLRVALEQQPVAPLTLTERLRRLPQGLLRPFVLGDVALSSPPASDDPSLDDASQIIQETPYLGARDSLLRLGVSERVPAADEVTQKLRVSRPEVGQKLREPQARHLLGARESISLGYHVVAAGDATVA